MKKEKLNSYSTQGVLPSVQQGVQTEFDRYTVICIQQEAMDELYMNLELSESTKKELIRIGTDPEEFITEFQDKC